ncbi:hypothetical protein [Janthinobacterium sp.]|uniref:hypothetical protein n=1 Tax=Janthinobacterium sp. TaxID=1871054 RepID=UPI00293D7301|nr:hypothetical protein [Janthinobacterium sp.]
MLKKSLPTLLGATLAACLFAACSPKFDWRDYRSPDASFSALFPAKPASFTRTVDLDGVSVNMTMTAAEVDGTTFAVGSAEMADPLKAQAALLAMKTAMVKNIGGTIKSEKAVSAASSNGATSKQKASIEVEASGMQNGTPMLLEGRFVAQDKRIYQIIVLGKEKHIVRDSVDTFMSSVKLN